MVRLDGSLAELLRFMQSSRLLLKVTMMNMKLNPMSCMCSSWQGYWWF